MLHEMKVSGITIDPTSNAPIVILKAVNADQALPIWIGILEATAIATELENVRLSRPMTHDLFKNFLEQVDMHVAKVDVCDLKDNTFFAKIHFMSKENNFTMDARPSDAIALAIRFKAPIFVEDEVFNKFKGSDESLEMADQTDEGKKWAEYLAKLNPDDFGKYKV